MNPGYMLLASLLETTWSASLLNCPRALANIQTVHVHNDSSAKTCAYATTLDSQEDVKEAFYASLHDILPGIPKEDKIIFLGISMPDLVGIT